MSGVTVTITDNGLGAALSGMRSMRTIEQALLQAGQVLKTEEAAYPGYFPHSQPFKSDASRRWFFWALKTGLIQVPRSRTMALANSWEVSGSGLSVTVGTAHPQAPLMKSERMARFHRVTGWESAPLTAMRVEHRLFQIIDAGIGAWVG